MENEEESDNLLFYICNPMRTGSTYLYNFFQLCTSHEIRKYENTTFNVNPEQDRVIVPIRHPIASLSSMIDYFHREHDEDAVKELYERVKKEFAWAYSYIERWPGVCHRIDYERFINNPDYIAKWVRNTFDIEVNNVDRFKEEFTIDNVKRLVAGKIDEHINLFQENHISEYDGNNEIRLEKVRSVGTMYTELKELANKYGYEF